MPYDRPETVVGKKKQWLPPATGLKMNVDGEGAGGLIRNAVGDWVIGFKAFINVNSAFEAEATALLMGLKMAAKNNYTQLTVSTHSMQLFQEITNNDTNENNLVCLCRALLQKLGNVQVLHEARSANVAAARLAKEGNKLVQDCFLGRMGSSPVVHSEALCQSTSLDAGTSGQACVCNVRDNPSQSRAFWLLYVLSSLNF